MQMKEKGGGGGMLTKEMGVGIGWEVNKQLEWGGLRVLIIVEG